MADEIEYEYAVEYYMQNGFPVPIHIELRSRQAADLHAVVLEREGKRRVRVVRRRAAGSWEPPPAEEASRAD